VRADASGLVLLVLVPSSFFFSLSLTLFFAFHLYAHLF
jgi:hypothetical protein